MRAQLAKEIDLAGAKIQYDEYCKRILGNKQILARILGRVAREFQDMEPEAIIPCIEGEPEIGCVPVHPGETNADRVAGMQNEDKVPGEGQVTFDIRFFAKLPAKRGRMKLIVNVEGQKNFYPGYNIVTRGIFYGARLISAQMDTEFEEPHYDELKKVYSIFINMNAPLYLSNAISEYRITKYDLIPGIPDHPKAYDKLSLIMVTLNRGRDTEDKLIGMLNTLFSDSPAAEKCGRLSEQYGIAMESSLGEEMRLMMNFSDLVEERGIEKGESRFAKLTEFLLNRDKLDELRKAVISKEYREELYQLYKL